MPPRSVSYKCVRAAPACGAEYTSRALRNTCSEHVHQGNSAGGNGEPPGGRVGPLISNIRTHFKSVKYVRIMKEILNINYTKLDFSQVSFKKIKKKLPPKPTLNKII